MTQLEDGRAQEPLTKENLQELGRLAIQDQDKFFARNPRFISCRPGLLCIALCQGGALHYVDGQNGVKDLDVWVFYDSDAGPQFLPRRRGVLEYPYSGLMGWSERVDVMARSIERSASGPVDSLVQYLRARPTRTAWELAQKAAVIIEPAARLGEVAWRSGASA